MKSFFRKIKSAIIHWLARRLPDCKSITPTLGESLDRRLTRREKILMKLHLWTCDKCTRYLEQIKFLRKAVHKHEERLTEKQSTTVRMSSESHDRTRNALKSAMSSAF